MTRVRLLQPLLFGAPADLPANALLATQHYLGPCHRSVGTYRDESGVLIFAQPTSRRLPTEGWLELVRWCIVGGHNAGSQQWAKASRWLRSRYPEVTTIVSYSDPSVGHTGALYRASNWLWAPTWHRLRPGPSGNGAWGDGVTRSVKDRWVYPLRQDAARGSWLQVQDSGLVRRWPWAGYREPVWTRRGFIAKSGGGDYKRFLANTAALMAAPEAEAG